MALYRDPIWVPPTRKEIEKKLRDMGVAKVRGISLRYLRKEMLVKVYCRTVRRLRTQREQEQTLQTLPLPGF